jgi:hypothetical protein
MMIPGQPHLDFTEALLQSRTVVIVFLITLAILIGFIAAPVIAERFRMSLAGYYFYELVSRLGGWHQARSSARRIDKQLRGCGFIETAPGRWEKRG